jgi:hypothetical protein
MQFLRHALQALERLKHHERQARQVQISHDMLVALSQFGVLLQILMGMVSTRLMANIAAAMEKQTKVGRAKARTSSLRFNSFSSRNRAILASRRAAASRVLAVEKLALSSV